MSETDAASTIAPAANELAPGCDKHAGESAAVAPTEKRGLECRHCGCKHFRVIYTRPAWGGRIMRRRGCRHCGKRMTTWEHQ